MSQIKAVSQWEISEITIDVQDGAVILFEDPDKSRFVHGTVKNAQVCLTLEEAKNLVSTLHSAIESYEYLDKCVEEDFGDEP